jgi:hypothetical protein
MGHRMVRAVCDARHCVGRFGDRHGLDRPLQSSGPERTGKSWRIRHSQRSARPARCAPKQRSVHPGGLFFCQQCNGEQDSGVHQQCARSFRRGSVHRGLRDQHQRRVQRDFAGRLGRARDKPADFGQGHEFVRDHARQDRPVFVRRHQPMGVHGFVEFHIRGELPAVEYHARGKKRRDVYRLFERDEPTAGGPFPLRPRQIPRARRVCFQTGGLLAMAGSASRRRPTGRSGGRTRTPTSST